MIKHHYSEEELKDNNKYYCSKCKKETNLTII